MDTTHNTLDLDDIEPAWDPCVICDAVAPLDGRGVCNDCAY